MNSSTPYVQGMFKTGRLERGCKWRPRFSEAVALMNH